MELREYPTPEPEPTVRARIIETDGSVFVASEYSFEDEGVLATGAFAGEQNHEVTVLVPLPSVRRIVFEDVA